MEIREEDNDSFSQSLICEKVEKDEKGENVPIVKKDKVFRFIIRGIRKSLKG